jgi:hypothetical protein
MDDEKRGDDAGDHAPRPRESEPQRQQKPPAARQDAPNYEQTTDGGRAIESGNLTSANDE